MKRTPRTLPRVTVVVLAAGLVAGWLAGMPLVGRVDAPGILDTLGKAFVDQRVVTLFILALPAIGVCEHFGLQERARDVVRGLHAATAGRLELAYHVFRLAVVGLGIRLGSGHVAFSRPLVVPMAVGAAGLDLESNDEGVERVKAISGASENYANFFGQNLFPASAGVAVILKGLEASGYKVDAGLVSLFTIPMVVASLLVATAQYMLLDRWLRRRAIRREDA